MLSSASLQIISALAFGGIPCWTAVHMRRYLFILENDFQAVGRVVYPVRETVKTEAEVAAMTLVRCKPGDNDTLITLF
jgi:hypothetical protein